jgi:hypothetical protein
MTELPKTTLTYLINYIPNNNTEKIIYEKLDIQVLSSYLNDTNSKYLGGSFYLGGQLKMKPDEEITLKKIDEVRQISKQRLNEYGGHANGWEVASVMHSETLLNQMEKIIKFHNNLLLFNELEKTKLNDDVNLNIVSFI